MSHPAKGFTLIEILIVLGVMSALLALGMFMTLRDSMGYDARATQATTVAVVPWQAGVTKHSMALRLRRRQVPQPVAQWVWAAAL